MTDPHYETVTHPATAHEDERGRIVNVIQGHLEHVAVITRAKGAVFGNHFHPSSPCVTPFNVQRMYLISGRYRSVSAPVDADGQFTGPPKTFIVEPGDLTEVGENIGHAYLALEDCVFLNINTHAREADEYGKHTKPLPVRLIP